MNRTGLAIVLLCGMFAARVALAQDDWQDDFESFEPVWRQDAGDAQMRIDRHFRQAQIVHGGKLAEWIELTMGNGTHAHLSRQLTPSAVIDEWSASLWVWANRPGVTLLARAVLPRTLNPATGGPYTVLLHGTRYGDVDRWQRLEIRDPVRLLQSEVRLLRARLGGSTTIDPGEAYIDQLLVDAYAGSGRISLALDDMRIAGAVAVRPPGRRTTPATTVAATLSSNDVASLPEPLAGTETRNVSAARVDHNGTLLLPDGRTMFVRSIRYRGESLSFLGQLGFNAIELQTPASAALLDEAQRVGLWVICPPPADTAEDTGALSSAPSNWSAYSGVLAWQMGWELAEADYDEARARIDFVRQRDRLAGRPLVCQADSDLRRYSRQVDFLIARRQALGTSLELVAYRRWLDEQARLARPGTPFWVTLPTEPDPALLDQISVLTGGNAPSLSLAPEKLRLAALTALASGSRGILFESNTRLDAGDPATERRARVLELLNLELKLIEPWAATGSPGEVIPAAGTNVPVTAAVLKTRRSQMLLPMWTGASSQWVPDQAALNNVTFVVPGVSEETRAYELTPAGLHPLRHERVTGGQEIRLAEFGVSSMVLLTSDDEVIAHLSRRLNATRSRAAQLMTDVALAKYEVATQVSQGIVDRGRAFPEAGARLQMAQALLSGQQATSLSSAESDVYQQARRAMRPLRMLERAWDAVAGELSSPVESPFAVNFATLPQQIAFANNVSGAVVGANQMPTGSCEDLDTMQRAGWRPWQHEYTPLEIGVALSPSLPHGGRSCLSLTARAAAGTPPPDVVESPPVWVTTPPVRFEASQLVKIHGWVRVRQPIAGTVDGLLVIDSWTGEALASRFNQTGDWREFTLYRAAPQTTELTLTFALTGVGEASIDDLTIEPVLRPATPPPPSGIARQGSAFAPAPR
ncbi:MAG: hypothetical protein R3C10_08140 [Pirellulales bacterium]